MESVISTSTPLVSLVPDNNSVGVPISQIGKLRLGGKKITQEFVQDGTVWQPELSLCCLLHHLVAFNSWKCLQHFIDEQPRLNLCVTFLFAKTEFSKKKKKKTLNSFVRSGLQLVSNNGQEENSEVKEC